MDNPVKLVIEKDCLVLKMPNGDLIPGVTKITVKNDAEDDHNAYVRGEILANVTFEVLATLKN